MLPNFLKYYRFSWAGIIFIACTTSLFSQEINFGSYSSQYSITLSEVVVEDPLGFGIIIQNGGLTSINISNSKVFSIEGVKYLDVIVTVQADDYLLLLGSPKDCETDVSCRIPFTLETAYANHGQNNDAQAVPINVLANYAVAQFPIKYRGNAPPGPPPTPVYEGYNPALYNDTAYLYIYGSINVGTVDAGSYEGQISITVSYD